jgi:hypothetical protein
MPQRLRLTQLLYFLAALVVAGCSMDRVNERVAYWDTETHAHLPTGTTLADAKQFFASRGLALTCCVSGPPGAPKYYSAMDRKVGRSLFTEYDVAILVAMNDAQRVETVRVERWGVGL